jgi:Ca2+-binding RTX toxin-like protein
MRRYISLPVAAVVLLLGCDRDGSQDLTSPQSPAISASVQDQIAALGCEAWWVDYSNGPIPVCDPADPSCLRDEWLDNNLHYDGFVVEGNTIYGTDQRDVILCQRSTTGAGVKLFGDEGDDTLFGTDWDDELYGGPGCDRIRGRDGNDLIDAGPGNDGPEDRGGCATQELRTDPWRRQQGGVWGDGGHDELVGGPGDDWIMGHDGNDVIIGGPGSDLWARVRHLPRRSAGRRRRSPRVRIRRGWAGGWDP